MHRPLALAVCEAQALAEVTREQVDAYVRPIFERYEFKYSGDLVAEIYPEKVGTPLPSEKELYLCEDSRLGAYYAELDQEHRRQGFNLPDGHCPALTAESNYTQAQGALIDAATELCGIERHHVAGSGKWETYVDLLLGACLSKQIAA